MPADHHPGAARAADALAELRREIEAYRRRQLERYHAFFAGLGVGAGLTALGFAAWLFFAAS